MESVSSRTCLRRILVAKYISASFFGVLCFAQLPSTAHADDFYLGRWECNDYFPFVHPIGCFGVDERTYLNDVTIALAGPEHVGHLIIADLDVYASECLGERLRFFGGALRFEIFGVIIHTFLWSEAVVRMQDLNRCPDGGGGGGGGGCLVEEPQTTILSLSGQSIQTTASIVPIERIGKNSRGGSAVMDEYTVVRPSPGFLTGVPQSNVVQESTPQLLIRHQGQHAANANYAPSPSATFVPQKLTSVTRKATRGFAVVLFDAAGKIRDVTQIAEDGTKQDPELAAAIARGTRTAFLDSRTHDHSVYFAYRISRDSIDIVGDPLVTLPMCCSPPPPCPGCEIP